MEPTYILIIYLVLITGGLTINNTVNVTFDNQTSPSPTTYYSINPTQSPFNNTIIEDLLSSLPLSSFGWTDIADIFTECTDPRTVGWCSNYFNDPTSSLEVDLGELYIIYSVSTWGIQDYGYGDEWVISYNLHYSTDGNNFISYINNPLQGNNDSNNEQKNVLNPYIITRFLRFLPIEFHHWKSFRVEASGSGNIFVY